MRAVNSGNTYTIYDNSIQLLTSLPAQTYLVNFDKQSGFFLSKYADIQVSEKMYGVHNTKLNKVMAAFGTFERNIGVILSGDKGIGKSSFAKLLAVECVKTGIPVVVVNTYIPGIAEYLASFDQTVMVLFDEFDKTFKSSNNGMDAQAEMLTLFDGLAQGKKMFVVTCNSLTGLNDFLVNRPGRFHYHFRFGYPTAEDIREYLSDKVNKEFHSEINKVVSFSRKIDLNYDCLRAIAFELNTGISFKEAILDLNIIRDNYNRHSNNYICKLYFDNGEIWETRYSIDMFSEDKEAIWFDDKKYFANDCLRVLIKPKELDYDPVTMVFSTIGIPQEDIYINREEYYEENAEERIKELTAATAIKVELVKVQTTSGLHYLV